ncbi:secernin-1 [Atheta coriaria]|uniref:secernin-1 n=1 Tax=Dalotia coriaria TaxID=877792 RepID=UPI0031F3877F
MSGTAFVVLPSQSKHGVIFGKNAARPDGDVMEVVFVPAGESSGDIQCTYVSVEAAGPTKAVILNKSSWTWGAESGANESGIAIGTLAVSSKYSEGDADVTVPRLLGVDLVRLGLERASSASEALDVITSLLEKYGQGGSSSDKSDVFHCNSFIIVDGSTCFVLDTCGKHWAVEEITSGSKCIANMYTIGTNITKHSEGLQDFAKSNGLWNGEGDFNFAAAFNVSDQHKEETYQNACKELTNAVAAGAFKESNMFQLLRSEELLANAKCPTMGAQVSTLSNTRPSAHWFTATQDPRQSVFKPLMFTPNAVISKHTVCPNKNEPHVLFSLHQAAINKQDDVQSLLRSMEQNCVEELDGVIDTLGDDLSEFDELLKDCVETEVKFYR